MDYLVEKTKQIEREIERCLENNLYLAALTLTLTIPDIYENLENKLPGSNRIRYTGWMKEYLVPNSQRYETDEHSFLDDIYALRCVVLHDGQSSIEFQRARKEVHQFKLVTSFSDRLTHLWGGTGLKQVEDHKVDKYLNEELVFVDLTNVLDREDQKKFAFHYKNTVVFNVWQFYIDIKKAIGKFVREHHDDEEIQLRAKDIFLLE